jgi:hypothetical protein
MHRTQVYSVVAIRADGKRRTLMDGLFPDVAAALKELLDDSGPDAVVVEPLTDEPAAEEAL